MTNQELLDIIENVKGEYILQAQAMRAGKRKQALNPLIRKRMLLLAAVISLLLLLVGCAVVYSTLIYGSPAEMIASLYGESSSFQSASPTEVTSLDKPGSSWQVPGYEKQPIEETVAQELEKWVSPVGSCIASAGYRLTVDSFIYDSLTRSGLITMLLEHENPLTDAELGVDYDGRICSLHGNYLYFSQYGWPYIIAEKTTNTQLAFAFYFYADESGGDDMVISFPDFDENQKWEELEVLRAQQIPVIRERLMRELTGEQAARLCQQLCGFSGYTGQYDDYYYLAAHEFDTTYAEEYSTQSEKESEQERITIPLPKQMTLPNRTFGNGDVLVNSLCVQVKYEKYAEVGDSLDTVVLHMQDGKEFAVIDRTTDNSLYRVVADGEYVRYMLNSAINIDTIQTVEVVGSLAGANMESDLK